jgi:mono/diheme cytochrome c family protein
MNPRPGRGLILLVGLFLGCSPGRRDSHTDILMAPNTPDRGRYLALHVSLCAFCHSEIDWKAEGFLPREWAAGGGRNPFAESMPCLSAPILTSDPETGASRFTDEQFDRALRQGVGADGRTLHPIMPYAFYHALSEEDSAAIAAYFRSIRGVRIPLPPPRIPAEIKSQVRPLSPPAKQPGVDRSKLVKEGEYLVSIAICGYCHTPVDDLGKPIPGMEFAGGMRLKGPWGDFHASNVTPDPSGIEYLGEEAFVHAMKTGELPHRTLCAIMPWGYYRGMSDTDLRAIYAFLGTLKPVSHFIDNSVAPTPCRKCGTPHGLGNKNG